MGAQRPAESNEDRRRRSSVLALRRRGTASIDGRAASRRGVRSVNRTRGTLNRTKPASPAEHQASRLLGKVGVRGAVDKRLAASAQPQSSRLCQKLWFARRSTRAWLPSGGEEGARRTQARRIRERLQLGDLPGVRIRLERARGARAERRRAYCPQKRTFARSSTRAWPATADSLATAKERESEFSMRHLTGIPSI